MAVVVSVSGHYTPGLHISGPCDVLETVTHLSLERVLCLHPPQCLGLVGLGGFPQLGKIQTTENVLPPVSCYQSGVSINQQVPVVAKLCNMAWHHLSNLLVSKNG